MRPAPIVFSRYVLPDRTADCARPRDLVMLLIEEVDLVLESPQICRSLHLTRDRALGFSDALRKLCVHPPRRLRVAHDGGEDIVTSVRLEERGDIIERHARLPGKPELNRPLGNAGDIGDVSGGLPRPGALNDLNDLAAKI